MGSSLDVIVSLLFPFPDAIATGTGQMLDFAPVDTKTTVTVETEGSWALPKRQMERPHVPPS